MCFENVGRFQRVSDLMFLSKTGGLKRSQKNHKGVLGSLGEQEILGGRDGAEHFTNPEHKQQ